MAEFTSSHNVIVKQNDTITCCSLFLWSALSQRYLSILSLHTVKREIDLYFGPHSCFDVHVSIDKARDDMFPVFLQPLTCCCLRAGHSYSGESRPGQGCHSNDDREEKDRNECVCGVCWSGRKRHRKLFVGWGCGFRLWQWDATSTSAPFSQWGYLQGLLCSLQSGVIGRKISNWTERQTGLTHTLLTLYFLSVEFIFVRHLILFHFGNAFFRE